MSFCTATSRMSLLTRLPRSRCLPTAPLPRATTIQIHSRASTLHDQKRFARVHDVRFVTTHRDQNAKGGVLDRYKQKLEGKMKEEGLKSVDDLKEAYKDKISEYKKAASIIGPTATSDPNNGQGDRDSVSSTSSSSSSLHQPPPPPQAQSQTQTQQESKPNSPNSGAPGIKSLDSYVDLARFRELPKKEIEYLWRLRFASDPKSLCAVVPLQTYQRIYQNARTHPQFILPLPRPVAEDGSGDIKESDSGFGADTARTAADIHFLQWGFHPPAGPPPEPSSNTANTHVSTVLFTHLAAFKLHGAYAQPHTIVTHHLDLADSHGLVLLNGSVTDGRGVSADEARWLLMCLQKFYDFEGHGGGIGREKRQGLLEKFSKGDSDFKLEELVDEAERVS